MILSLFIYSRRISKFIFLRGTYLIYSIIEATLCSLIGAFVGSVIDDFGFSVAAQRNKLLSERQQDINLEYEKELRRIEARKKVEEELDGSV